MKNENKIIEKSIFKNCYELEYINNYIFKNNIIYYFNVLNEYDKLIIDYEFYNIIEILKKLNLNFKIYCNENKNEFLLIVYNKKVNLKISFNYKN